ncbi:MAG TPA: HD domain-containing phosphohydrolase [Ideonella sp.]|uniref:HD domain-containing phosphohydrolase n=1 Tax=Ideonella sp. TaxID=1929293 RepID=UPI002E373A08|nr:HD domain-containing phosphohydrolase [Ideonella sp.]HEX5685864.1 HD domain-containing phosphohydrolase [Ideonella sp.]
MTEAQALVAAPAAGAAPASTATLLLVDDEPSILSALRRLFRPQGYRILIAEGGAAALELVRNDPVDLVISDMRMPGMDGAQFLEKMRQMQPDAARILLTGYADISSTIAAINCGQIHRYIAKPWDDNDIVLVVREALARRQLERQNQQLSTLIAGQNEELRQLNGQLEQRVKHRTAEIEQINDMLNVAYDELKSNFMLSMRIFSGLMDLRHSGLAGQSSRVSEWVKRVCVQMKLDERQSHDAYVAALLHGIGKIGFPDGMLGKPLSTLSSDETARYRKHTLNAEAALMPLAQLQPVARIIRSQHERIDGNGFPDGLEGDEIPLGARILAPVVDYENLINGTLAERRFTAEDAASSIRRGAGTRYDAKVVAAFVEVLKQPLPDCESDREISALDLVPGMVLSRDLVSTQGTLLLAAGYMFDARVVRQVREYAQREGVKLTLRVRKDNPGGANLPNH